MLHYCVVVVVLGKFFIFQKLKDVTWNKIDAGFRNLEFFEYTVSSGHRANIAYLLLRLSHSVRMPSCIKNGDCTILSHYFFNKSCLWIILRHFSKPYVSSFANRMALISITTRETQQRVVSFLVLLALVLTGTSKQIISSLFEK